MMVTNPLIALLLCSALLLVPSSLDAFSVSVVALATDDGLEKKGKSK